MKCPVWSGVNCRFTDPSDLLPGLWMFSLMRYTLTRGHNTRAGATKTDPCRKDESKHEAEERSRPSVLRAQSNLSQFQIATPGEVTKKHRLRRWRQCRQNNKTMNCQRQKVHVDIWNTAADVRRGVLPYFHFKMRLSEIKLRNGGECTLDSLHQNKVKFYGNYHGNV